MISYSPKKPLSHLKRHYLTLSQAVVLAAGAASFAAVTTALLASHMFYLNPHSFGEEPNFEGPVGTIYSRTVIASNQMSPEDWNRWGHNSGGFLRAGCDLENLPEEQSQEASVPLPPSTNHDRDTGSSSPKVVWLMSFPNSGTSFTLHLTREASNTTTATNYALEGDIKDKPSVPVLPGKDGENGPWLELIPNRTTTVPEYIITKTHCGGFCSYCTKDRYIETPRSFQVACQSGTKAYENKKGKIVTSMTTYDSKPVKKAIHIFRHPMDNVVARFHLDYLAQLRSPGADVGNYTNWPELYPKDRTGFQQWCELMDRRQNLSDLRWIDQKLHDALVGVPCKADFFRYVQWHNNAFAVIRDLGIPVMHLHYSDYKERFEQTLDNILTFLELPRVGPVEEFIPGKEYGDYYTREEKQKIYAFLEESSTAETWNELKVYKFRDEENVTE